mmetsp:Transcript_31518/g.58688  ORF Transcript_31518/g.58688 Transcript_31518/m.58688 type:complete len:90 (-) Transcript_31518:460-729(-)
MRCSSTKQSTHLALYVFQTILWCLVDIVDSSIWCSPLGLHYDGAEQSSQLSCIWNCQFYQIQTFVVFILLINAHKAAVFHYSISFLAEE